MDTYASGVGTTVYAYPFDLVGDSAAAGQMAGIGADSVTLAAAYHSVRASTPRHPAHRIVDASFAAVYTRLSGQSWAGRRLVPREAGSWATRDSFAIARDELERAGVPVRAWLALLHSTAAGRMAPELCVVNAFGDRYEYALCPSAGEVREYAATLAYEVIRAAGVESAVIEAAGQLGVAHQSRHDKSAGADWSADAQVLLSICFCTACGVGYSERGTDAAMLARRVRDALGSHTGRAGGPEEVLGDGALAVLETRRAASTELFRDVVQAARSAGARTLSMHLSADLWGTGSASTVVPGVTALDRAIAHSWSFTEGFDAVRSLTLAVGSEMPVGAYCTVLGPSPVDRAKHLEHWRGLIIAGATELHLYHAGLASTARLEMLAETLAELQSGSAQTASRPY